MSERRIGNKTGERDLGSLIPRWMIRIYLGAALVLVPWAAWLYISLPPSHLDRRWNLAWAGFDGAPLGALALTAYFAWRTSGWVVVAATASATLLLIDAWFDTLSASIGKDYAVSLVSATCVELPLAGVSLWIAYRAGRRFFTTRAGETSEPGAKHD